jgi:hypothetical protein
MINIERVDNSNRPRFLKDSATIFFNNTLEVQFIKEISDNYAGNYYKNKEVFEDLQDEKNDGSISLILKTVIKMLIKI